MQMLSVAEAEKSMTRIYGLMDPKTGKIRYIGKSSNPKLRLYHHMYYADGEQLPKSRWIRKLKSQGMEPDLIILEQVPELA